MAVGPEIEFRRESSHECFVNCDSKVHDSIGAFIYVTSSYQLRFYCYRKYCKSIDGKRYIDLGSLESSKSISAVDSDEESDIDSDE